MPPSMNNNEPSFTPRQDSPFASHRPLATEEELRALADDIVRYCPSLTHLLLALGAKGADNPLRTLN